MIPQKVRQVETKVIAAAVGGGVGDGLAEFLIWLLGVLVWHQPYAGPLAEQAGLGVPGPVQHLVRALLVLAGVGLGGYTAPHTARPGDATPTAEIGIGSVELLSSAEVDAGRHSAVVYNFGGPVATLDDDPDVALARASVAHPMTT